MPRFRSVITTQPSQTLTPSQEAAGLVSLARSRPDEDLLRRRARLASPHARKLAASTLGALGYSHVVDVDGRIVEPDRGEP